MDNSYAPTLSFKEVNDAIAQIGIKRSNKKVWQLFLLGILAGIYIGLGAHFFIATLAAGFGKILGGAMFSVGLMFVVIAGAELFTGNATILIGVLSSSLSIKKMLKNWLVVYIGNFAGSIILAWLIYKSGLLGEAGALNDIGEKAAAIAEGKLAIPFVQAFIRGILCNILVILAIIMSAMAKDLASKILCIVFPIACFVACGFEHCIANMYLIPLGLMAKGMSLYETYSMFDNLIPVTLGNIVGGTLILTLHPNRIRQIKDIIQHKQHNI